jgi:hypothetical protein
MRREVGVWIDHKKAVIASIAGDNEDLRQVASNVGPRVRYSGRAQKDAAEDQRDRRFTSQLNKYYDRVVSCIRDADSILILGAGEAKIELRERLEKELLGARVVGVEAADKMTDGQLAARVREHYLKSRRKLGRKVIL